MALSIDEGQHPDRVWEVSIDKPETATADDQQQRQDRLNAERTARIASDVGELLAILAKMPDTTATRRAVRDLFHHSHDRFNKACAAAIESKDVLAQTITKGNGRPYDALKLAERHV